jgi:tRNA (guanine37-N1)-methyltransferase
MRIDILSCVPSLMSSFFEHSILKRAQDKGIVEVHLHDLKAYSPDKHGRVDDYAYGGGAGMVMTIEPIANCIRHLQSQRQYDEIIYMTPDGQTLEQKTVNRLSMLQNIIILCGHYKGIDERVRQTFITQEISVGDFVLSGGEIPAVLLADAIIRLIPHVLNDETSALTDSFQDGLLAPPVYTRPAEWEGKSVPEVLLSGNEAHINQWRWDAALQRTQERRPDMWHKWTEEQ